MPIDINFGALQAPNPFQAYAQGQEVGQQMRLKQARRQAGNMFATDPEGAAQALLNAGDWEGGLTVRKTAQEDRQTKARTAAVDAYTKGDVKGAQAAAVGAGDFDLASSITKMDKDQRDQAKARADTLASVGLGLKDKPYEARKAIIQQIKPTLVQQGMDAASIDGFDPTDENIAGFTAQAMSVKELIDKADKDRTFTETVRSHKANEATAARNASTSAYSAQTGRLSYDARKAAGGFGTPGVGGMFPTLPGDPNDYEHHPAGGE